MKPAKIETGSELASSSGCDRRVGFDTVLMRYSSGDMKDVSAGLLPERSD